MERRTRKGGTKNKGAIYRPTTHALHKISSEKLCLMLDYWLTSTTYYFTTQRLVSHRRICSDRLFGFAVKKDSLVVSSKPYDSSRAARS